MHHSLPQWREISTVVGFDQGETGGPDEKIHSFLPWAAIDNLIFSLCFINRVTDALDEGHAIIHPRYQVSYICFACRVGTILHGFYSNIVERISKVCTYSRILAFSSDDNVLYEVISQFLSRHQLTHRPGLMFFHFDWYGIEAGTFSVSVCYWKSPARPTAANGLNWTALEIS